MTAEPQQATEGGGRRISHEGKQVGGEHRWKCVCGKGARKETTWQLE